MPLLRTPLPLPPPPLRVFAHISRLNRVSCEHCPMNPHCLMVIWSFVSFSLSVLLGALRAVGLHAPQSSAQAGPGQVVSVVGWWGEVHLFSFQGLKSPRGSQQVPTVRSAGGSVPGPSCLSPLATPVPPLFCPQPHCAALLHSHPHTRPPGLLNLGVQGSLQEGGVRATSGLCHHGSPGSSRSPNPPEAFDV